MRRQFPITQSITPMLGLLGLLTCAMLGCQTGGGLGNPDGGMQGRTLTEFPERQVTGVTVSRDGRVFACFPYWTDEYEGAVAEVRDDGTLKPYPNEAWNAWRRADGTDMDPRARFVCVQSVVADGNGHLWVLDPAAPSFQGPVEQGPKLVKIDLETDQVVDAFHFDRQITPRGSYLNDVRIDAQRDYAYITDSGRGAIVVVNLQTGDARRVLADHPATQAEDVVPVIGGTLLRTAQGDVPKIHADGIALSPDGQWLYFHALTGYHLYRVPTNALRDAQTSDAQLGAAVQDLGRTVICDGMIMDGDRNLYLTDLEHGMIVRRKPDGTMSPIAPVGAPPLQWPDTLAIAPDGALLVTASQIHHMARFNTGGATHNVPFRVYRFPLNLTPRVTPDE